jgi:hypothetical protein
MGSVSPDETANSGPLKHTCLGGAPGVKWVQDLLPHLRRS